MKSELHVVEREAKEDKERAKNFLDSVTGELKTLKTTLEEVMKRERQVCIMWHLAKSNFVLHYIFLGNLHQNYL